jgi:hypothetical protein
LNKTAVEWLIEQLKINNYISDNAHWLVQEAKEMEKEQIIKFAKEYEELVSEEVNKNPYNSITTAEEFYTKTYE